MKIEAVVVSRNYGDFLHYTLPHTKAFLADFVVVTSPDDQETRAVCQFHGARCIVTDVFDRAGGPFNKGAAINQGLLALCRDAWLLIMDADILVPPHVRPFLEEQELDQTCIYGVDRRNCDGLEALKSGTVFPMMKRVQVYGAEPPPGYFQLWHSTVFPHGPWYDDSYVFADRTDVCFAKSFSLRQYLKTWVLHLDKGRHAGGVNWRGRESPRFVSEDELRLDLG